MPDDHRDFRSNRWIRRVLGLVFGGACLVATFLGVFVLALLVWSVVSAAIPAPPDPLRDPVVLGAGTAGGAVGATAAVGWSDRAGPTAASRIRGLFHLLGELVSRINASDPEAAGYRVGLVSSLWLLALVAVTGIPVGIGAGVYLEEYARPGRIRRLVQTNIANLAGVPSIVYGILGLALFVRGYGIRALALGPVLISGVLTLSLLILPIIVITTQESLRAVPQSLRQAALALGATRWQVVRDHVLPSALPGILTGTILGLSRAIGETAPLLMVGAAGSLDRPPRTPFDRYSALPVEIYNYAHEPGAEFRVVVAGGILILVALLLTMNAVAIVIRNRYRRSA
ncbi:MAG: phosphate ABC transporter permease PstA [Isosphaeraceae bacterium]